MTTNWRDLAHQVGSLRENGSESGGDSYAQQALENILGDEWIESTVEHILAFSPGRELALNCLSLLQSTKAANYAYQVYKTSNGERAEQAVYLIKHLKNPISLSWIEEFLNDEHAAHWGLGVLDQLLWTEQIPFDDHAKSLLKLAETKMDGQLSDLIDFIRQYICARENR